MGFIAEILALLFAEIGIEIGISKVERRVEKRLGKRRHAFLFAFLWAWILCMALIALNILVISGRIAMSGRGQQGIPGALSRAGMFVIDHPVLCSVPMFLCCLWWFRREDQSAP